MFDIEEKKVKEGLVKFHTCSFYKQVWNITFYTALGQPMQ